jgi:hypothetical protein
MTVQSIVTALTLSAKTVIAAKTVEDLPTALKNAQAAGTTHVFEPTILNWEDRATEWSGRPDRVTLRYVIYDVATGKPLASTLARASSKWATFGGDHPQDLLPVPTQTFVHGLF